MFKIILTELYGDSWPSLTIVPPPAEEVFDELHEWLTLFTPTPGA